MISSEAIKAAKAIPLPDPNEVFVFTDYDREMWQKAFDWYNKTFSPEHEFTLSCRLCYNKVFNALLQAQKS